jgi:hypothetical protein
MQHSRGKYASTDDLAESHLKNRVKKGGSYPSVMRNNGVSFEMFSIFKSSFRNFCSKIKIHKMRIKISKERRKTSIHVFFRKEKSRTTGNSVHKN